METPETPEVRDSEDRFFGLTPSQLNATEKKSLIALAMTVLAELHEPGQALCRPDETRAYLRLQLADREAEMFGCLFLDNRHRILAIKEMFQGTIDSASVHPRVVVQYALKINAAAIVFFHNHPSGIAEPSSADRSLTRRLCDALALVDIRVLDHFVIAAGDSISFAESGLL